jgi:heat shock protein HslJ
MRRLLMMVALPLTALLIAACGGAASPSPSASAGAASPTPSASAGAASPTPSASGGAASPTPSASLAGLSGTTWTVTTIGGTPTDATKPPTMDFGSDGTIIGSTGCNTYSGTYKLDGASITIGPLLTTLVGCIGPIGAQEASFVDSLQKAAAWESAPEGGLNLTGPPDTQGRYRIVAKPATS